MTRLIVGLSLLGLIFTGCSSEKISLSPLYRSISGKNSVAKESVVAELPDSKANFYASELTSHVSTFPVFGNQALNREIAALKVNVRNYVYSMESYNLDERQKALKNVERSYKKIQKLRSYLNPDDNDVINRYLVRIKSNIANLEAISQQQSNAQL